MYMYKGCSSSLKKLLGIVRVVSLGLHSLVAAAWSLTLCTISVLLKEGILVGGAPSPGSGIFSRRARRRWYASLSWRFEAPTTGLLACCRGRVPLGGTMVGFIMIRGNFVPRSGIFGRLDGVGQSGWSTLLSSFLCCRLWNQMSSFRIFCF